jgi:hypothetical protein
MPAYHLWAFTGPRYAHQEYVIRPVDAAPPTDAGGAVARLVQTFVASSPDAALAHIHTMMGWDAVAVPSEWGHDDVDDVLSKGA